MGFQPGIWSEFGNLIDSCLNFGISETIRGGFLVSSEPPGYSPAMLNYFNVINIIVIYNHSIVMIAILYPFTHQGRIRRLENRSVCVGRVIVKCKMSRILAHRRHVFFLSLWSWVVPQKGSAPVQIKPPPPPSTGPYLLSLGSGALGCPAPTGIQLWPLLER